MKIWCKIQAIIYPLNGLKQKEKMGTFDSGNLHNISVAGRGLGGKWVFNPRATPQKKS